MNINCCENASTMINGNSVDIALQGCDSEVKADIVVTEYNSVRLWGQVTNCNGDPVPNVLLKLVKVVKDCSGRCLYQGIAHTVSDCYGFYQFDLCADDPNAVYRVLANKSAVGMERIVSTGDGNCNACTAPSYNPCGEYKCRVTPPDYIDCNNHPSQPCGCNPNNYGCTPNPPICNNYCEQIPNPPCSCPQMGPTMYAPTKVTF